MERLLLEFVNTLDSTFKRLQRDLGASTGTGQLTINQFQYIEAVYELGHPTISDIAAKLGITRASATAGINKLVKLGYITKTQSSEDKRVFHASLDAPGHQLMEAKAEAFKAYGEIVRSALSADEARQFEQILNKIVNLFD